MNNYLWKSHHNPHYNPDEIDGFTREGRKYQIEGLDHALNHHKTPKSLDVYSSARYLVKHIISIIWI